MLKAFIAKCVNHGMGHHNTFIQVGKFARETLVPEIEKQIGKKIRLNDTRFFPTRRTVYTYWTYCSGGSVRAREDQQLIQQFLKDIQKDDHLGSCFYSNFEPFDPSILAKCYGITLNKTFDELMSDESQVTAFISDSSKHLPVLPDAYFEGLSVHLRPSSNATAQQRYDMAVKLLIRDCSKQNVKLRANIQPRQRTGAFYLFLQSKGMADFYKYFGHDSILFMYG